MFLAYSNLKVSPLLISALSTLFLILQLVRTNKTEKKEKTIFIHISKKKTLRIFIKTLYNKFYKLS